jgi:hypothetical protein
MLIVGLAIFRDCDPSIETAVCSVIWAAPRTDQVKELAPVCLNFSYRLLPSRVWPLT